MTDPAFAPSRISESQVSDDRLSASRPDPRSLEIMRVFAVRPKVLWDLFTDPVHFARWWGPSHCTCTTCELDLRVGGDWLTTLTFPDGDTATMFGRYTRIEAPNRLDYTWIWRTADGDSPTSAVRLDFTERGTGTLLHLRHADLPEDRAESHLKGWTAALESLVSHLKTIA